jgi:hypothetical protein
MRKHIQVGLARTRTEAIVEFKRRYYHVEFPDFGMVVRVSPDALLGGLPIGLNEGRAAYYAAEHLEALTPAQIQPVLRQALAAGRESQAWACRKLGMDPCLRHHDAVTQARALVGEQHYCQHREAYTAQRKAKLAAPWERRRRQVESTRRIGEALDAFLQSDQFQADQASRRVRDAEQTERLKARLAAETTPEAVAAAREQRRAREAELKRRMGL